MSQGNSPAFPCQDKDKRIWTGMNLRDYFAMEAMNAEVQRTGLPVSNKHFAKECYELADAMLDERAKHP